MVLSGDFPQQDIDLPLPEDFQVGVGLVDQEHRVSVRIEVGEDQEQLLQPAAGDRHFQRLFHGRLTVEEGYAAAGGLRGIAQFDREQPPDQARDFLPVVPGVLKDQQTQIPQYLRGLALSQQDVDAAGLEDRLVGLQPRHRIEQMDAQSGRRGDGVGISQRDFIRRAVDQILALIAKPHGHRLDAVAALNSDRDQDRNIPVAGTNGGVVPEVPRALHRNGDDVQAVERRCGSLLRPGSAFGFVPGSDRLRPQRDRLDGGRLAAVVRPDQHRRVIELDALSRAEVLEVPDLQVVQQSHRETSPVRVAAVDRSTSTSSATTVSSPASLAVSTMGSKSGLTGCSVILAWRQESPAATRSPA